MLIPVMIAIVLIIVMLTVELLIMLIVMISVGRLVLATPHGSCGRVAMIGKRLSGG